VAGVGRNATGGASIAVGCAVAPSIWFLIAFRVIQRFGGGLAAVVALAAGQARHVAGAASAVLGVVQAIAMAVSAPLASSGGSVTAVPMIWVMIAGVAGSLFAYIVLARPSATRTR
jgi:DHA1 family bicyclomycin/chloramphenicol resistance-like MFS transporter